MTILRHSSSDFSPSLPANGKTVRYHAGLAEWYIEELLAGDPAAMTGEELSHLSQLYRELRDDPVAG